MVRGIIGISLSLALLITLAYRGVPVIIAAPICSALALMTYGGISLFVVAFVMFPLARELFRVADIPARLIPATIELGIFTVTMTALPGTPQVQNIIPGQFFGTSTYAAPGIGLLGTAAGCLDTLPPSGAVVTLLLVCGMTHRQSYKDLAMVTIVAPVITVIALLALVSAVGSF